MLDVDPAVMVDMPFYSDLYGEFLSSTAARLQEILQDYNPNLELVFIPSSKRDDSDTKPFAIRDTTPGKPANIVRHFSEAEVKEPHKILAWLFAGDLTKHSPDAVFDRIMLEKKSAELFQSRRDADIAEERQELIASLSTGGLYGKTTGYRHGGKIFTDRGSRDAKTHH